MYVLFWTFYNNPFFDPGQTLQTAWNTLFTQVSTGGPQRLFFLFFIFILKIFRKIYTHFNPIWKIFDETTLNTSFFLKKKWVFRSFFRYITSSFFLFFSLILRKRPFFVKNGSCLTIQKRYIFRLFPADFLKKSGIKWHFSLYI